MPKFVPTTHTAGHRASLDGQELTGLGPGQLFTALTPLHGEAAQTLVTALDANGNVKTVVVTTGSTVA
jgi:hypothetical protein